MIYTRKHKTIWLW